MPKTPSYTGLIILPRLRVQNANAISSSMTWGFPSMTAFMGLMWNLQRKIDSDYPIIFRGVGVVCHDFEPQISSDRHGRTFHLTRNPLDKFGEPPSITEEGRAHLEITLVFAVDGGVLKEGIEEREKIAQSILDVVGQMRVAGGSVIRSPTFKLNRRAELIGLEARHEMRTQQFRKLRRLLLPGFALVSRDDLLTERSYQLRDNKTNTPVIDAWLDIARLNIHAVEEEDRDDLTKDKRYVEWKVRKNDGWLVPIPVGYGGISQLYSGGQVANTRDETTPFRFVESVYSIGQWIGPHHLSDSRQLIWYPHHDFQTGLYRCRNDFVST